MRTVRKQDSSDDVREELLFCLEDVRRGRAEKKRRLLKVVALITAMLVAFDVMVLVMYQDLLRKTVLVNFMSGMFKLISCASSPVVLKVALISVIPLSIIACALIVYLVYSSWQRDRCWKRRVERSLDALTRQELRHISYYDHMKDLCALLRLDIARVADQNSKHCHELERRLELLQVHHGTLTEQVNFLDGTRATMAGEFRGLNKDFEDLSEFVRDQCATCLSMVENNRKTTDVAVGSMLDEIQRAESKIASYYNAFDDKLSSFIGDITSTLLVEYEKVCAGFDKKMHAHVEVLRSINSTVSPNVFDTVRVLCMALSELEALNRVKVCSDRGCYKSIEEALTYIEEVHPIMPNVHRKLNVKILEIHTLITTHMSGLLHDLAQCLKAHKLMTDVQLESKEFWTTCMRIVQNVEDNSVVRNTVLARCHKCFEGMRVKLIGGKDSIFGSMDAWRRFTGALYNVARNGIICQDANAIQGIECIVACTSHLVVIAPLLGLVCGLLDTRIEVAAMRESSEARFCILQRWIKGMTGMDADTCSTTKTLWGTLVSDVVAGYAQTGVGGHAT